MVHSFGIVHFNLFKYLIFKNELLTLFMFSFQSYTIITSSMQHNNALRYYSLFNISIPPWSGRKIRVSRDVPFRVSIEGVATCYWFYTVFRCYVQQSVESAQTKYKSENRSEGQNGMYISIFHHYLVFFISKK